MPRTRQTPLDRAIAAKEAFERSGHPVREAILDGKKVHIVFYGADDASNDLDLMDMKLK